MLTIFEGPDGAGKTTLIEALIKGDLSPKPAVVEHHGAYPGEASISHHYLKSLRASRASPQKHMMMDRSWLAEPIYGWAHRNGEDRVGLADRRMLERVALACDTVVVKCLPPLVNCLKAFNSRREREYLDSSEALTRVYHGYSVMADRLPTVSYDYMIGAKHTALWNRIQTMRQCITNLGPGIGRFAPGVTPLVGDRMNAKEDDYIDLPFVDFSKGGCSTWLANQLEQANVPEDQLYWINATRLDGTQQKSDFIDQLKPRQVVALGEAATEWCENQGVKATTVHHPQFWKRFKSSEPYQLLGLLQEAL